MKSQLEYKKEFLFYINYMPQYPIDDCRYIHRKYRRIKYKLANWLTMNIFEELSKWRIDFHTILVRSLTNEEKLELFRDN